MISGKLDPQIKDAIEDITDSYKMLNNLSEQTVVYNNKIQLIKFHKVRIKICLVALLKDLKKRNELK